MKDTLPMDEKYKVHMSKYFEEYERSLKDVNGFWNENVFGTVFKVDPAPLGLTGFALTTFMLSFVNAGIIGSEGLP